MARFPHYEKNAVALGRLLANAALDPALKAALKADPKSVLRDIGLPDLAVELFEFQIVDARDYTSTITLPYRLNAEKVAKADEQYLSQLGGMIEQARLS